MLTRLTHLTQRRLRGLIYNRKEDHGQARTRDKRERKITPQVLNIWLWCRHVNLKSGLDVSELNVIAFSSLVLVCQIGLMT